MPKVELVTKKFKEAFSTAEVILAVSIFSLLVAGLAGALFYSTQASSTLSRKSKANYLASEGIEAVRNIRDFGFTNLVDGTYGLSINTNKWQLSGSSDITDGYTRQVNISTVDSYTKKITSTITWSDEFTSNNKVVMDTYLTNWLRVVTLGTWTSAALGNTVDLAGTGPAIGVRVSGDYAYVIRSSGTPNFQIINISNSSSLQLLGSLTLQAAPTAIYVSGNYAYVASSANFAELQIIDITNKNSPVLVGQLDTPGSNDASGVYVSGTTAYVTRLVAGGASREFHIVNVAAPAAPVLLSSLDSASNMNGVYISGNYAYVSTDSNTQELVVINISNQLSPAVAGSYNISVATTGKAVNGFSNNVFLSAGNNNLYILNATNPASITLTGTYTAAGGLINDITFNATNQIAFLATSNIASEFIALNIATLSSPTFLSSYNGAATLSSLAYDSVRNVIYAASSDAATEFIQIVSN